jgi:hypothetical protein
MIKVDVDGAEPFVMEGWSQTIERHNPIVLTEFSPTAVTAAGRDPRALFDQLCDDFTVSLVDHKSTSVYPVDRDSYQAIAELAGGGVTDLILSARLLRLPNVSTGRD